MIVGRERSALEYRFATFARFCYVFSTSRYYREGAVSELCTTCHRVYTICHRCSTSKCFREACAGSHRPHIGDTQHARRQVGLLMHGHLAKPQDNRSPRQRVNSVDGAHTITYRSSNQSKTTTTNTQRKRSPCVPCGRNSPYRARSSARVHRLARHRINPTKNRAPARRSQQCRHRLAAQTPRLPTKPFRLLPG